MFELLDYGISDSCFNQRSNPNQEALEGKAAWLERAADGKWNTSQPETNQDTRHNQSRENWKLLFVVLTEF